jgi:hypothetical protein
LGVFILWQILYLVGFNGLRLVLDVDDIPADDPRVPSVVPAMQEFTAQGQLRDFYLIFKHWGQVTNQAQHWCLFAPGIGTDSVFMEVEFRWDGLTPSPERAGKPPDRSVYLKNSDRPADLHSYFRSSYFRYRKFEGHLHLTFSVDEEDRAAETAAAVGLGASPLGTGPFAAAAELISGRAQTPEPALQLWRRKIIKLVRQDGPVLKAYLNWRWVTYHKDHPDRPRPKQLVLWMTRYGLPAPGQEPWEWDGPHLVPVARWRPHVPVNRGHCPLEMYNPVTRRFESLPRK